LPVIVRVTRALVLAEGRGRASEVLVDPRKSGAGLAPPPSPFKREFMRWVVLPINVVSCHRRLHRQLDTIQSWLDGSPDVPGDGDWARLAGLNGVEGDGTWGVIAAGFAYRKLMDLLGDTVPPELCVLRLGTCHPLPVRRLGSFLRKMDSVLVLEETAPVVERAVRAAAQRAGLTLPIYGRDTGHVPRTGELFAPHIATALERCIPEEAWQAWKPALHVEGESRRPMPSRDPLCEGCPYISTFDALIEAVERLGGRDRVIVTGDPGCMVRAQLPPYELMDIKHSLGSSIGMAAGIALSPTNKRVIALCGDSGFLHSGLGGLVDAVRAGARMLVLILDNGTTALSGGQPHPASQTDARGRPRRAVDLAALVRAAGVDLVRVVDLDRGEDTRAAINTAMSYKGVAVVIVRGRCPRWVVVD